MTLLCNSHFHKLMVSSPIPILNLSREEKLQKVQINRMTIKFKMLLQPSQLYNPKVATLVDLSNLKDLKIPENKIQSAILDMLLRCLLKRNLIFQISLIVDQSKIIHPASTMIRKQITGSTARVRVAINWTQALNTIKIKFLYPKSNTY